MSKAIIFGAAGQDGIFLSELLSKNGVEVIAISRSKGFLNIDITDFHAVSSVIKTVAPNYIFHFAAQSSTQHNFIFENNKVISLGTINILEAVKQFSSKTKVFISGSALQFKNDGKPIDEKTPFEAKDAYSASRIASVYMGKYFRSLGVEVYIGYFFNHDSELRKSSHMSKKIAEAAKIAGQGIKVKLAIGSLNVIKEYTHAKDVVEAVWIFINQNKVFEVVIGSGIGFSIKDWAEACFSSVGLNYIDFVETDSSFKPSYNSLIADPTLIKSLGWNPKITFEDLKNLMMK